MVHRETPYSVASAAAVTVPLRLRWRISATSVARKAEAKEQYRDAAAIFEQAAKEVGGLYTNLRKIEDVSPRKALAQLLGIQEEQLPTSVSSSIMEMVPRHNHHGNGAEA